MHNYALSVIFYISITKGFCDLNKEAFYKGYMQKRSANQTSLPISGNSMSTKDLNLRSYDGNRKLQEESIAKAKAYRQTAEGSKRKWLQNLDYINDERSIDVALAGKDHPAKAKLSLSSRDISPVNRGGLRLNVPMSSYTEDVNEIARRQNDPQSLQAWLNGINDLLGHESVHSTQKVTPHNNRQQISTALKNSISKTINDVVPSMKGDSSIYDLESEASAQQIKTRLYRAGIDPYSIEGENMIRRMLADPKKYMPGYFKGIPADRVEELLPEILNLVRGVADNRNVSQVSNIA